MKRMTRQIGALAFSLAIVGCGGSKPLTMAEFQKVQTGMTEKEVKAILGEGELTSNRTVGATTVRSLVWKDGADPKKNISVTFQNDKVQAKSTVGVK